MSISPDFDLSKPFALIAKGSTVICYQGEFHALDRLDEVHALSKSADSDIVFALPYRVIRERGFAAKGDEPILAIAATSSVTQPRQHFLERLPNTTIALTKVIAPSQSDAEYAELIAQFQSREIEGGNASQTTLSRRFSGHVADFGITTLLSLYRRLLADPGPYMTVLFRGPEQAIIGATPERHLEIRGNETIMVPIAGTLRKEDRATFPERLRRFVNDPKEINELFQVLDEEMKMMSLICPDGGTIRGPYLREIGAVVHSEYELAGKRGTNSIDALRHTLHAPTVTGSPMESAARIIERYEPDSRRYYAGEIGVYRQPRGDQPNGDLDSAILIRCAEFTSDGSFGVQAGGGVVRDSVPEDEARESRAKAMGFLAVLTGDGEPLRPYLTPELRSEVMPAFEARNAQLSPFWMQTQNLEPFQARPLPPLDLTIINNEDDFAHMLSHLFRHMGSTVNVVDNRDYEPARDHADILVIGPGPGDPTDMTQPGMVRLQAIITEMRSIGRPMLGICLGHQALAVHEALTVTRQSSSTQGMQRQVNVFGHIHHLGFYNSFSPVADDRSVARTDIACDIDAEGRINALRGPGFIGFQFHPESVMSRTGYDLLREALMMLSQTR